MNEMLKFLIIMTLVYYLFKGLLYLLLWEGTKKMEKRAIKLKKQKRAAKSIEKEIWKDPRKDN